MVTEPQPVFAVTVGKPVYQEDTNRYNVWVAASFENVPTQLQVRLRARQTGRADGSMSVVYAATEVVQCPTSLVPVPVGQHPALTAHHRLITALARTVFRDDRPAGPLDAPLMRGVESLAKVTHALDTSHTVAGLSRLVLDAREGLQFEGMMRDQFKPQNGGITGVAFMPTYDPVKYRYELTVEFWSGPTRLGASKDSDGSAWLTIPFTDFRPNSP